LLQNIRDRSTGWIAYVIVIGISIPFALWGIDQYFTSSNVIVAEINDTKISLDRLNNEYQNRLQEMQSMISKDKDEAELQKKIIKRTVLDELIDGILVREFVNKNKFQISETSLINDIKNNKIFHNNKKFDANRYQKILQSQNIKIPDYERIRISELKALQFYNNIVQSSYLSSKQIEDLENIKYQTRNFKLLSLNYNDFIDNNKNSTEEEKKDFYVKYKNIFSMPEKLDIEYIIFNKSTLKKQLVTNNQILENYYNENKFKYIIKEKRNIAQIFLSNTKNEKLNNLEIIKSIKYKLTNGHTFASIAKQYSHDKLSNYKGGDIGWVTQNELSKEINKAVFTIKNIGDISDIVETVQGYYIVKLLDLNEAKIKSFINVKELVKKDYEDSQIINRYSIIFEDLSNILYENPDSLEKASELLSVRSISTGLNYLSRIKKEHNLLNNEKVMAEIRSKKVYKNNLNSAPIEIKDNIIMLRINNKSPVTYKKYDDVKKEIEDLIKTENSIVTMKDTIKDIENKIAKGISIKDIEDSVGKKSVSYIDIGRDDKEIPSTILLKVFSLTPKNKVTSIESGTGNYELILLDNIIPGDSKLSKKSLESMFNNEYVNTILYSTIQSLREQSSIRIYTENL
jgi:peptidyl-prolyl cis-trans isomerase D